MIKKMWCILVISLLSLVSHAADLEKLSKGKWLKVTTENFDIITDLNEKKAKSLMRELEAYKHFQQEMIGVKLIDGLGPLRILALSSTSNFKRLDLPKLWAGVFVFENENFYAIANVNGYSDNLNKLNTGRHILFHEYNHFLSKYSVIRKTVPLWYEEGKAEYLATFKFDGHNIYLGNPKAIMFRIQGLYSRTGNLAIDSENIFKTKSIPIRSENPADGILMNRFYGRSFFIVHYINSSLELRKSLASYLNAVNAGTSEEEAIKKSFGQTFDEFDKSVASYVTKSLMMRVISLKEGKIEFPEPEIAITKMTPETFKMEVEYFFPKR